jgi:spermidine/putrescine transport system substrate-binding protein
MPAARTAGATRRHFLISTAFAGVGLPPLLSACGGTVDTTQVGTPSSSTSGGGAVTGELVLYNYADYVDEGTYAAFAEEFPDVEVVRATYASEEEVSARMRAGGASEYDNVVVAGTTAAQLNAEGLLMPIDRAQLLNLAGVDPALVDDSQHDPGATFSVPKNYGITGIGYDSSVVTVPPTTWAEFFEALPEFAPRTLLLEGATSVMAAGLAALGYSLGDGDDAHIAAALDLLLASKPHIGNVSTANFYTLFGSDDVVLGQAYNGDVLRLRAARTALEFVVPSGPADGFVGVWAIPAQAPNPAASHAWINTLLAPENAAREMSYSYFPVSVPAAYEQVRSDPAFDVPWITATPEEFARLAAPVLTPETLRKYSDAYTRFQAA